MQSEADIRKVLDAAEQGEAGDDNEMDPVRSTLRWILGIDDMPADEFIRIEITDPYI